MNKLQGLLLVILLWPLAASADESMDTEEMPGELQLAIEENSKLVIESLSELAGFTLGMNTESVKWLDGFIERSRDEDPDQLVDILGSYFGNAIIARYGGTWVLYQGVPAVAIEDNFVAFPFSHVAKHFENGQEDSIAHLYEVIESVLEEHRQPD